MVGLKKKSKIKRLTASLMAAVLAVTMLPASGFSKVANAAESARSFTGFGTNGISAPAQPSSAEDSWSGSYVYYGKYNGQYVKYRVLSPETDAYGSNTMFLDSDSALFNIVFDGDGRALMPGRSANEWEISDFKSYINGSGFLNIAGNFSKAESSAIAGSTIASSNLVIGTQPGQVSDWTADSYGKSVKLGGEKVFVLDAMEASNVAYGYYYEEGNESEAIASRKKTSSNQNGWWLRSADRYDNSLVGAVYDNGSITSTNVTSSMGVSPAFNIDLSRVFANIAVGDSSNEYKLSVFDDDMSLVIPDGEQPVYTRRTVQIPYTVVGTNADKTSQVSYLILDKEYTPGNCDANILQYGQLEVLGNFSTDNDGMFTIPSSLQIKNWDTDYFVYVFAENINEGLETDYASSLVRIYKPDVAKLPFLQDPIFSSVDYPDEADPESEWYGKYVYYGKYNNEPVRYRILEPQYATTEADCILLDCDNILYESTFNSTGKAKPGATNANEWLYSDVCKSLNGDDFLNNAQVFTDKERDALVTDDDGLKVSIRTLDDLDNSDYGYATESFDNLNLVKKFNNNASKWWTRTPEGAINAYYVGDNGVCDSASSRSRYGVSPAIMVDYSKIIMMSVTEGDEDAYTLTLRDPEINMANSSSAVPTIIDSTVYVPFELSGENASEVTKISVMILAGPYFEGTINSAAVRFYDELNIIGEGMGSFEKPANIVGAWGSDYYVYIFAEDVNGGKETNYASNLISVAKPQGASVAPTPGPTSEPTVKPSVKPSAQPTVKPSAQPTDKPTAEPTEEPTAPPTAEPTAEPTAKPTVEPGIENVTLGTKHIARPVEPKDDNTPWTGSFVYFGKYNNENMLFRVLDPDTSIFGSKTMFLDCDSVLKVVPYDSNYSGDWAASSLKQWLNGDGFLGNDKVFSEFERNVIAQSAIESHEHVEATDEEIANHEPSWKYGKVGHFGYYWYVNYLPLVGEKIFILDVEDASNGAYGYPINDNNDTQEPVASRIKEMSGDVAAWWLRGTVYKHNDQAAYVEDKGYLNKLEAYQRFPGVSPALNIDLSKLLLATTVSGNLDETGAVYRLTFEDDDIVTTIAENEKVSRNDHVITVPFSVSGDKKAEVDNVSVIILDKEYEAGNANDADIIYYNELDADGDADFATATFVLPYELDVDDWNDEYYVYIFAQDETQGNDVMSASKFALVDEPETISINPTMAPTEAPTEVPTSAPSAVPSVVPSTVPTVAPTTAPSTAPSLTPTKAPTSEPTAEPTEEPTVAPTAKPTAEPEDPDPVRAFVIRVYKIIMGRDPSSDQKGVNYWTNCLKQNEQGGVKGFGGVKMVQMFIVGGSGEEYNKKNPDCEKFLLDMYCVLMGRERDSVKIDDAEGFNFWMGELEKGAGRESVLKRMANCQEFKDICANAGIQVGDFEYYETVNKAPKISAFVARIYTKFLNRGYDFGGLEFWTKALVTGQHNVDSVMKYWATSPEVVNSKLSDEEYIRRCYYTFFDREPEESGFNWWVGELKAKRKSRTDVVKQMAYVDEFMKIKKDAGLK